MPSLDGYSLNKKMDEKFEEIDEQIEVIKFRIDTEMEAIREHCKDLILASNKTSSKQTKKKEK